MVSSSCLSAPVLIQIFKLLLHLETCRRQRYGNGRRCATGTTPSAVHKAECIPENPLCVRTAGVPSVGERHFGLGADKRRHEVKWTAKINDDHGVKPAGKHGLRVSRTKTTFRAPSPIGPVYAGHKNRTKGRAFVADGSSLRACSRGLRHWLGSTDELDIKQSGHKEYVCPSFRRRINGDSFNDISFNMVCDRKLARQPGAAALYVAGRRACLRPRPISVYARSVAVRACHNTS